MSRARLNLCAVGRPGFRAHFPHIHKCGTFENVWLCMHVYMHKVPTQQILMSTSTFRVWNVHMLYACLSVSACAYIYPCVCYPFACWWMGVHVVCMDDRMCLCMCIAILSKQNHDVRTRFMLARDKSLDVSKRPLFLIYGCYWCTHRHTKYVRTWNICASVFKGWNLGAAHMSCVCWCVCIA